MGRVIFIGAGPGQADLITVRGAQRLAEADVVLYDALTDPALRALAPHARWIDVGKRGLTGVAHAPAPSRVVRFVGASVSDVARSSRAAGSHGIVTIDAGAVDDASTAASDAGVRVDADASTGQNTINALLVKHARRVSVVVRLKGGDPSVFGRLEEELEALARAGIDCEVVPGVTAALAAAAATRRPLTRRGSGRSVSLTTAMTHDSGLVATHSADTEVFYMAGRQLGALSRRLVAAGWPAETPASVVSRAGWPDQIHSEHNVATLGRATVLHAGRPTVVTIGAGAVPLTGRADAGSPDRVAPQCLPKPITSKP